MSLHPRDHHFSNGGFRLAEEITVLSHLNPEVCGQKVSILLVLANSLRWEWSANRGSQSFMVILYMLPKMLCVLKHETWGHCVKYQYLSYIYTNRLTSFNFCSSKVLVYFSDIQWISKSTWSSLLISINLSCWLRTPSLHLSTEPYQPNIIYLLLSLSELVMAQGTGHTSPVQSRCSTCLLFC